MAEFVAAPVAEAGGRPRVAWRQLRFPITAFLVWRLAHVVIVVAAAGWGGHSDYFRWDGEWYRRIMTDGYALVPGAEQPTAFFPLLPWVTGAVKLVVRSDLAAALIVTTIASAAAVCLVYRVLQHWRGDDAARWGTVLLLAFPTSVFLWLFYTEGLLIAFAAAAVLAFQRDRPAVAGVLCAGAALSRPPGILVAVILAVAHARRRGLRRAAWYGLAGLGLLAVVVAQQVQAGDGLTWLHTEGAWHREPSVPLIPLIDSIEGYLYGWVRTSGWSRATLDTRGSPLDPFSAVLFLGLAALAARRHWPGVAQALILLFALVPLASGLTLAMGRFVLAAWPAFGVLGETRARLPAAVLFGAVSVAVIHDSAVGLYVG